MQVNAVAELEGEEWFFSCHYLALHWYLLGQGGALPGVCSTSGESPILKEISNKLFRG